MNAANSLNPAPRLSPWRWWVCILLMLATVVNYMDRIALNQMAVPIKKAFGLNNAEYGWLESVFSITFALGAVIAGFIVDRKSVRWIYPLAVLGWSAAGFLTGFAGTFWMLLLCRSMLGIFEAANWPCGLRTTRAIMAPEERSLGNSLFQSGTALGAVITPLVVGVILRQSEATGVSEATSWRIPFQVIGLLGLAWVALWFLTVPPSLITPPPLAAPNAPPSPFSAVLRDRRYWAALAVSVGVNLTWHGYRAWLPSYLQEERGYSRDNMNDFSSLYYLIADVGSWTVGLATLIVCKRGMSHQTARILMYTICVLMTLCTLAVPVLPNNWALAAGLLVVAFGALGLFPTYYALSQEVSAAHQGKVSGTIGATAHVTLAALYPIEGWICDRTGTYEWVLGGVGMFPLIGLIAMLWLWPRTEPTPPPVEEEEEPDW